MSAEWSRDGERIVFIEFNKDMSPFQIITEDGEGRTEMYDIEFSKDEFDRGREPFVVSSCGNGTYMTTNSARWWAAPGWDVSQIKLFNRSTGETLEGRKPPEKNRVPNGTRIGAPGVPKRLWVAVQNLEKRITVCDWLEYCNICDIWFGLGDHRNQFCEHVYYCRNCGNLNTPEDSCCDAPLSLSEQYRQEGAATS